MVLTIEALPRVVAAEPGRPRRPGAAQSQAESRRLAVDPGSWTRADAQSAIERYAELAPAWDDERGAYRPVPLRDALRRGGPYGDGPCLEVGCGTGLLTPLLRQRWPAVVCLDLSADMLARSPAPWRARADASALPVASASMRCVVLADVPLFAGQVARVLRPGGTVIWSNALGDAAPHFVPVDVLAEAFNAARPEQNWTVRASVAGWGSWAVLDMD